MAYLGQMESQPNVLLHKNQHIIFPLQEFPVIIKVNELQTADQVK